MATPEDGREAYRHASSGWAVDDVDATLARQIWHQACLEYLGVNLNYVVRDDLVYLCPEEGWEEYLSNLLGETGYCEDYDVLYEGRGCNQSPIDHTHEPKRGQCTLIDSHRDVACLKLIDDAGGECDDLLALRSRLPSMYQSAAEERLRPCLARRLLHAMRFENVMATRQGAFDYNWDIEGTLSPEVSDYVMSLIETSAQAIEANQNVLGLPHEALMARWEELSRQEIAAARSREEARAAAENAPPDLQKEAATKLAEFYRRAPP